MIWVCVETTRCGARIISASVTTDRVVAGSIGNRTYFQVSEIADDDEDFAEIDVMKQLGKIGSKLLMGSVSGFPIGKRQILPHRHELA
jgi:hypothetical protein